MQWRLVCCCGFYTKEYLPPKQFRSPVIYQIQCPSCTASYVGCTVRHLSARIGEHHNIKAPVGSHFTQCVYEKPDWEDVKILHATPRSVDYLLALEALYIEELKTSLNTRDEYRSRTLTLGFLNTSHSSLSSSIIKVHLCLAWFLSFCCS